MTTGVGAVADVVGVNEGWTLLAALKGVRGGDELEKLFPWVGPFFEFFLGEFCHKTIHMISLRNKLSSFFFSAE